MHTMSLPYQRRASDVSVKDELKEVPELESSEETPQVEVEFEVPWKIKWASLIAIMLLPLGVNWASASLGPLKATLRKELGINNEQFGVISSADAIVNTLWPIVGGIILDWVGVELTAPACTFTILMGSIVASLGVSRNNWRMLAGGYIIQGFGTALLDSCQHVIFHAFGRRRGLAFAFSLENAFANATGAAAKAAAIPIRDALGLEWVFWIPVILCALSLLVNAAYAYYVLKMMPTKYRATSGRQESGGKKKFSFRSLTLLPWCFWMLPVTQIFQSGVVGGVQGNTPDIVKMMGYTEAVAGFMQSGSTILKILIGPLLGYAVDRWGHRFHYVAAGPLLWIICISLLNYSKAHPMPALVISAFAQTLSAGPLQMAVHLLVADYHLIGTAFGVWRAFSESGSTVMDVLFGRIQDGTAGMRYTKVLNVALGMKALAFVLGIGYILFDYKYLGKGLTMTRVKRDEIEKQIILEHRQETDPLTRREPIEWVTYSSLIFLGATVICAWVLFFLGMAG